MSLFRWYWNDPDREEKYDVRYVLLYGGAEEANQLKAQGWLYVGDTDDTWMMYVRVKPNYTGPVDRMLVCQDCKGTFTFTASEQRFFKDKGLSDPKRCATCRDKRRAKQR